MEKVLSGKPVATALNSELKRSIEEHAIIPVMALLRLGNDPASGFYVQNIIKQGTRLGCEVRTMILDESTSTSDLLQIIQQCNLDDGINGIMIQKPLPSQIDSVLIDNAVDSTKDIDGINPLNTGRLWLEQDTFLPCTAEAVIEMIKYYQIETTGKHVVILGRSAVVGKPLAGLLLQKTSSGNATVTVCHSKTTDLKKVIQTADILVAAIGKANFVTAEMMSENTICLDVGINDFFDADKGEVYVGDIDYNSCFDKTLAITPVPGGVGSVTTALLFRNLVKATLLQKNKKNS